MPGGIRGRIVRHMGKRDVTGREVNKFGRGG